MAALILSCSGANSPSTMMMPSFDDRHGDIAALAFEHVDVVAEIGGLDLDLREIRRRRRGRRRLREHPAGQRQHGGDNGHFHLVHSNSPQRSGGCPSTGLHGCRIGIGGLADGRPARRALCCRRERHAPDSTGAANARKPEVMTSPIAGGVDCDLHPAVPHLTSLLPYHERLLARPGHHARHDRPGVAVLSHEFADLLAAGLAAREGQAGLEPRGHADAGARSVRHQLSASAIRCTACRWCFPRIWRSRSAAR